MIKDCEDFKGRIDVNGPVLIKVLSQKARSTCVNNYMITTTDALSSLVHRHQISSLLHIFLFVFSFIFLFVSYHVNYSGSHLNTKEHFHELKVKKPE